LEKVWDELKKIEAQAEQIQIEARQKAKDMVALAEQEAEKLIVNSKTYAEEEAQQLLVITIQEANRNRNEQLKTNQAAIEKLSAQAANRMEQATTKVLNRILGETKS
jgi:vacuolar-type H+-ATPase subunit H